MQIVTFAQAVQINFRKSDGENPYNFEAGRDYVISAHHHDRLMHDPSLAPIFERSSFFEPRVRAFRLDPNGGHGKSVLFHSGAGGYGDQVMMWPVVRWLAESAGYTVHVLTDFRGNESCWWHFPWVTSLTCLPQPLSYFNRFDELCLFEQVTNTDEHPGQLHPVDAALYRMGLDPKLVPAERKRVSPAITAAERGLAKRYQAGRRIALYAPSATAQTRTLPPDLAMQLAGALAREFPEYHWLSMVDSFVAAEYKQLPLLPNLESVCFPSLRHLFAVAEIAEIGVSPDSLLCHIMGSLGKPCVGLWGATDPALRVAYYPKHVAISNRQLCPKSPCLTFRPTFPPRCPTANTGWCGVTPYAPEQVIPAVRKALGQ